MKKVLLKQEVYQKMFRKFNHSMLEILKSAEALGEVTMDLDGYTIRFKRNGKKLVRRWKHDEPPAVFEETTEGTKARRTTAKKSATKKQVKKKLGRPKGSKNKK